jgi:hypothetical protein
MTTILKSEQVPADTMVPADTLNVRSAVVGDGLMLHEDEDGRLSLHTLWGGQARRLGTFDNAAEAWAELDRLDLADDELDLAA